MVRSSNDKSFMINYIEKQRLLNCYCISISILTVVKKYAIDNGSIISSYIAIACTMHNLISLEHFGANEK